MAPFVQQVNCTTLLYLSLSFYRRNLTSFQLRYLDVSQLYGHLGDDYNPQLSQIEDPNRSNSGVEQPRISECI